MSVNRVQIVIVKPAGYAHAETFRELAETLLHGLAGLGIEPVITENAFSRQGLDIVLGWHLLDASRIPELSENTTLYNLEQFDERNEALRLRLTELSRICRVWDYSLRNIEILRGYGFTAPLRHVPIGYVPQLNRIGKAVPQDIDVLFYGSLNERRKQVLQQLEAEGLRVHAAFGVYGPERDALIGRAKVVLNLHYYESSIFEMVRVSYLLANRKAVVAECHARTEVDEDIRRAAVLVPYEDLVPACVELVRHEERRELLEIRAQEIISRRDETVILRLALSPELEAWGLPADSAVAAPDAVPDPAVSVVLITRNRPVFLRRALESLQAQVFRDFEVLLVNDGGVDIAGLVVDFTRSGLTIDLQTLPEDRGQSAARNKALLRARGRWIAYLDDDDLYYPDHLQVLVDTLRKTGAKVAYTDSMRAIEEERNGEWVVLSRELAMSNDFNRERFLRDNLTPINNVMHERACWEVCGPHDETLPVLEDWDYWIRLSRRWSFVHVPSATAEVRWRASGANITFQKQDLFPECRRRIARKIEAILAKERGCAMPTRTREALLFEPDWGGAEWVEVLLSYLQAFAAGEPVALVLPLDPALPGQLPLEEAQARILDIVTRTGRETFPDVVLLDRPEELLETLKGFARAQWIPKGKGRIDGMDGPIGLRFAEVRRRISG